LFPLANAISIQGMIFTVGAFIGPSAVVSFSCYRTISRTVTQGLAVVNKSYWPEFSENYGRKNFSNLAKLFKDCSKLNILLGICSAILLLVFGKFIIATWSRGLVSFDLVFFSVMTVGVAVTGFWQAHWVYLMAINKHSRVSVVFMGLSLFMLLISIPLLLLLGVTGAGIAIVAFELSMAVSIRGETKKYLRLSEG
jgi:O-antigen/teichoic acid export membrane protein